MARIGWEPTAYKKPAVESYQTANVNADTENDMEVDSSSENDLLFKRVVISHICEQLLIPNFILISAITLF
jgi:5'-nucleotidase